MNVKNDTLLKDFLDHLNLEGNSDIILSAPFGTGKTYFLREDFTPATQEHYNTIHLYPVNYSVANNEDIFELIKYDILFELVLNYKDSIQNIDSLTLDKGLAIQLYIQSNFKILDFAQQVFKATSKLGKSISDILDLLKLEKGKFDEFYNTLKDNEYDTIKAYLESFEHGQGVKEFDAISALISEVLVRLKSDTKQNVLVIDDLDRIDPEHIFRIFNVLSAHRDYHTSQNKFGFDKVILVCDIENIRRIYEHRYGKHVDFQGYVNKFYSKSIYQFNNSRFIKDALHDYLVNLKYEDFGGEHIKFRLASQHGDGFYHVVHALLHVFVSHRLLSLRSLKNIDQLKIQNRAFYDAKRNGYYKHLFDYDFLVLVEYLSVFFGNRASLGEALRSLVEQNVEGNLMALGIDRYNQHMIARNLLEMTINIVKMDDIHDMEEKVDYTFRIWDSEIDVAYQVVRAMYSRYAFVEPNQVDDERVGIDVLRLFSKTLDLVESRKYLS